MRRAYLPPVSLVRLIWFLTILALAWSPLATIGTAPASAMAHHAAMRADAAQMTGHDMAGSEMATHDMTRDDPMATMPHCEDRDGTSKDQPCRSGDCLMACAAVLAIAVPDGQFGPRVLARGLLQQGAPVAVPHGLVPEAATPPPRRFLKL